MEAWVCRRAHRSDPVPWLAALTEPILRGDVPIRDADLGNLALRVCINGACDVVPVRLSLTGRSQVDCHGGRRAQCWVSYSGGTTVHVSEPCSATGDKSSALTARWRSL